MSTVVKLREAQEANAVLGEQLAKVESERNGAVEADKAKAAALEKAQADITAAQERIAELKAETEKAVAEAQAERDAEKARADSAEQKLSNPAFEHAAEGAENAPDAETGETKTDEQWLAEYHAESDPAKRAQMWRDRNESR